MTAQFNPGGYSAEMKFYFAYEASSGKPSEELRTLYLGHSYGQYVVYITQQISEADQVESSIAGISRFRIGDAHVLCHFADTNEVEDVVRRNTTQLQHLTACFRFDKIVQLETIIQEAHCGIIVAQDSGAVRWKGCSPEEAKAEFCNPGDHTRPIPNFYNDPISPASDAKLQKGGYALGRVLPNGKIAVLADFRTLYWTTDYRQAATQEETDKGLASWLGSHYALHFGAHVYRITSSGPVLFLESSTQGIPQCEGCGACCRCGYRVNIHEQDWPLTPSTLRCHSKLEHIMRRRADKSCLALDLNSNLCTSYHNRPPGCRNYEPGTLQCLSAVGRVPKEAYRLWLRDLKT